MSVFLTSFKRVDEIPPTQRWSAAVYQPDGYNYPKADCWDIRDGGGNWIRPSNFATSTKPLVAYRIALWNAYNLRRKEIEEWLQIAKPSPMTPVALCCWCPYSKPAKQQLREFGSFVCHLSVVGDFLSTKYDIPVWYDRDRVRAAVLEVGTTE